MSRFIGGLTTIVRQGTILVKKTTFSGSCCTVDEGRGKLVESCDPCINDVPSDMFASPSSSVASPVGTIDFVDSADAGCSGTIPLTFMFAGGLAGVLAGTVSSNWSMSINDMSSFHDFLIVVSSIALSVTYKLDPGDHIVAFRKPC